MTEDVRRVTFRCSAEDVAWIEQQAADEGVDNATMVRIIINRLRRGRAPLVSMMERARQQGEPMMLSDCVDRDVEPGWTSADDVLSSRLSEMEQSGGAEVIALPQSDGEAAALPIRRVDRQRWNPGRK